MTYILNNVTNCPIKGKTTVKVTSDFGKRKFYNNITKQYESGYHNGIDIIGGNEIVSFLSGIVTSTRKSVSGYSEKNSTGNYVTITHGNNLYSSYYHLKKDSVCVKKGDYIEKGTKIGLMGATGHATGKHLHFGIKKNGKWVDPKPYLLKEVPNNKNNSTEIIYVVKKGDNLTKIAARYNTTWQSIYNKNKELIGNNPNLIKVGWHLKI